jgi:hypothetical protein
MWISTRMVIEQSRRFEQYQALDKEGNTRETTEGQYPRRQFSRGRLRCGNLEQPKRLLSLQ